MPELVDGRRHGGPLDYVAKDDKINLDDIAPFFREFNQKVSGKTYTITIDGDFQMAYYRKDVFDKMGLKPPRTWEEYLANAKALNGKDFNGDGQPDFGSCMFKKRNAQSYFAIMSFAAAVRADPGHRGRHVLRPGDDEAAGQQRGLGGSLPHLQGDRGIRAA